MTIYDDDKVFDVDGISIIPNMDIFLEILSGLFLYCLWRISWTFSSGHHFKNGIKWLFMCWYAFKHLHTHTKASPVHMILNDMIY